MATTTGREENIAEESTLAVTIPVWLFVCYLFVVSLMLANGYFFVVSHMLANGGETTATRMVATTTGREDNIAEESTLATTTCTWDNDEETGRGTSP